VYVETDDDVISLGAYLQEEEIRALIREFEQRERNKNRGGVDYNAPDYTDPDLELLAHRFEPGLPDVGRFPGAPDFSGAFSRMRSPQSGRLFDPTPNVDRDGALAGQPGWRPPMAQRFQMPSEPQGSPLEGDTSPLFVRQMRDRNFGKAMPSPLEEHDRTGATPPPRRRPPSVADRLSFAASATTTRSTSMMGTADAERDRSGNKPNR